MSKTYFLIKLQKKRKPDFTIISHNIGGQSAIWEKNSEYKKQKTKGLHLLDAEGGKGEYFTAASSLEAAAPGEQRIRIKKTKNKRAPPPG